MSRGMPRTIRRSTAPAALALLAGIALTAGLAPVRAEDAGEVRQESYRRLNEGIRLLRTGDGRAAAEQLCWVAARALSSHDAHWYCGQARLAARDPEGAVEVLEIAVELEPRHLGTLLALGDACLEAGDPDRARASYYRALDVRQDYSPAWDGLARVAVATGDEPQALEFFGKALEANAADARARIHRGDFHLAKGRIEEALADAREAARLRPDDPEVQLGLARTLLAARLPGLALAPAREAIRLTPRDVRALVLRAEIYLALDALPEAEAAAREALAIDPEFARARVALADALGRSGRIEEALAALGEEVGATAATREDAGAALRREAQRRWRGRIDELTRLAVRVLGGAATADEILDLAETNLSIRKHSDAAELARQALALAPDDARVARRAAYVIGSAGKLLEAEELLLAVGEREPLSGPDLVNLGVLKEQTGDPEGAAAAYSRAADTGGGWSAYAGLARLRLAAGDQAGAVAALEALLAASPPVDEQARATEALRVLDPSAREAPAPVDGRKK